MTCIAAVVGGNGVVYMGGDSAGVSDDSVYSLGIGTESKIWESEGILFGASGSFRVAQVVRRHMHIPQFNPAADPLEYLTGSFVSSMREALRENGALRIKEEDSTEEFDGSILLGFCGHVFAVFSDFGVEELVHGYGAVGCGAPIALGSLATSEGASPKKRIKTALLAAERHSAGVRGPMTIIKGTKP